MTAAAPTTARDRFLKLLKDDILQLDLAALDFGIYRILNYRRREIDAFLDGELPTQIDAALNARRHHGGTAQARG